MHVADGHRYARLYNRVLYKLPINVLCLRTNCAIVNDANPGPRLGSEDGVAVGLNTLLQVLLTQPLSRRSLEGHSIGSHSYTTT